MISALVHTKNSEKTLKDALKSIKWADEVIVVDMGSSDKTLTIAKHFTARIYNHVDKGYVEPARNFGITKAKGDWILIVDSDEEIPDTLASKLREIENNPGTTQAYAIARKNIVFGQKLISGGWWPDYNIRFFKKGSVIWPEKIHSQPIIKGKKSKLEPTEKLAILHHHYQSVEDYLARLNHYTTIEAQNDSGSIKGDPLSTFFDDFFRRYYQQQGYKDGELGIYLSLFQAIYQISTQAKRKIQSGFSQNNISTEIFNKIFKDWKYWHATYQIDISDQLFVKSYWRARRWLRI